MCLPSTVDSFSSPWTCFRMLTPFLNFRMQSSFNRSFFGGSTLLVLYFHHASYTFFNHHHRALTRPQPLSTFSSVFTHIPIHFWPFWSIYSVSTNLTPFNLPQLSLIINAQPLSTFLRVFSHPNPFSTFLTIFHQFTWYQRILPPFNLPQLSLIIYTHFQPLSTFSSILYIHLKFIFDHFPSSLLSIDEFYPHSTFLNYFRIFLDSIWLFWLFGHLQLKLLIFVHYQFTTHIQFAFWSSPCVFSTITAFSDNFSPVCILLWSWSPISYDNHLWWRLRLWLFPYHMSW